MLPLAVRTYGPLTAPPTTFAQSESTEHTLFFDGQSRSSFAIKVWLSLAVLRVIRRACRTAAGQVRRIRDLAVDGARQARGIPGQVALKSSGDTLSRNSLNFSTSSSRTAPVDSSSFSSGMSSPASASTASST